MRSVNGNPPSEASSAFKWVLEGEKNNNKRKIATGKETRVERENKKQINEKETNKLRRQARPPREMLLSGELIARWKIEPRAYVYVRLAAGPWRKWKRSGILHSPGRNLLLLKPGFRAKEEIKN